VLTVSALATTLFLGGYRAPPGLGFTELWLGGWFTFFWFLAKLIIFFFFFIWLRGTLPRLRYDQFMKFGWKVLIPVSLIWTVIVATLRAMSLRGEPTAVIVGFTAGVVLVLLIVASLFESAKRKKEELFISRVDEVPHFAVPKLPITMSSGRAIPDQGHAVPLVGQPGDDR
jgi:NADH-quinone oxidoreductase subunit H